MATLSFQCPKCQRQHDRVKPEMAGSKVRCQCGYVFRLGPKKDKPTAAPSSPKSRAAAPVSGKPVSAKPVHGKPTPKKPTTSSAASVDPRLQAVQSQPRSHKSKSSPTSRFQSGDGLTQSDKHSQSGKHSRGDAGDEDHSDSFANFEDSAALDELIEAEKEKAAGAGEELGFKPASPSSIPSIKLDSEDRGYSATKPGQDVSVDELLGGLVERAASDPLGASGMDVSEDDDILAPLEDIEEDDVLEPIEDDGDEILSPIQLTPQVATPVTPVPVYVPQATPVPAPLVDPSVPIQVGATNPFASASQSGSTPGTGANPYSVPAPYLPSPGVLKQKANGNPGPTPIVIVPGVFLSIIGGLNILFLLLALAGLGLAASGQYPGSPRPPIQPQQQNIINVVLAGNFLVRVAQILLSVVLIIGGIAMIQCKRYSWAMSAAIIALFPACAPMDCVLIEPAVGLWALIVLCQGGVSRRF